jgi:AcrR family transcriptional regulator
VTTRMHIPAEPAQRSRPGMSTGRIMAAALQIVDTEGSQALTMRRLGQALDRKVMTLYRYVPSKDALLDGVVARVLTDLAVNPAAADWRQELRELATSFRDLALAHPNAVPLLVTPAADQPPRATAASDLAAPGRLPRPAHPRRVQPGRRTARLPAVLRIPARARPGRAPGPHRGPRRGRRPAPARLAPPPPPRIPRLRSLAPELASYDGAAHLEQGVDMMITGLQSHFQPAPTSPAT